MTTRKRTDSNDVPLDIGPAILWTTKIGDQDVSFIAKWLHEFHAENRLEGDHVFLSFALDW